jgi:patatin-related protein
VKLVPEFRVLEFPRNDYVPSFTMFRPKLPKVQIVTDVQEPLQATFELQLEKEVRFALVMYGGVSLAVYINGVAQEFYSLVRSTADDGDGNLLPVRSRTEATYRKLACALGASGVCTTLPGVRIRSRFVVDILSGTSAGGINAVFLAKALSEGQDFRILEEMWLNQADISGLLNDRFSGANPHGFRLTRRKQPESLLDSGRMYALLLGALDRMEGSGLKDPPLAQEVDLFVTATDLAGLEVPIQLADQVVFERRHRAVFHFRRSPYLPTASAPGSENHATGSRDDFRGNFNPFLAFAARCTSAFPVAFEPMRLKDIDPILEESDRWKAQDRGSGSSQWQPFLDDYVADGRLDCAHPPSKYPSRSFADGGYLNNKPFSYAIEELGIRGGDLPYERKLVYIEPSPDSLSEHSPEMGKPDAIANAVAASLTLPRYQTIREDLRRVTARNRLVRKIYSIIAEIEDDIDGNPALLSQWLPYHANTYRARDLTTMVQERGALYAAYHRLKIKSVTEDLTRIIVAFLNLDESSDDFRIIYYLVWAWRSRNFSCDPDPASPSKRLESDFLLEFDGAYRERRLYFIQSKLDTLYGLGSNANRVLRAAGMHLTLPLPGSTEAGELQSAIRRIRGQRLGRRRLGLVSVLGKIRLFRNALLQRGDANPLSSVLKVEGSIKSDLIREMCGKFQSSEEENRSSADSFLRGEGSKVYSDIDVAMTWISRKYRSLFRYGARAMQTMFPDHVEKPETFAVDQVLQFGVRYFYDRFDFYDAISFPITYGTDVGILKTADVHRISPQDATSVIDELHDSRGRRKLAGDTLFAFGAFFQRWWRENDVMWGRLDGAERIISSVLPGKEHETFRSHLVEEAHLGIIEETMCKVNIRAFQDAVIEQVRHFTSDGVPQSRFDPNTPTAQQAFRAFLKPDALLEYLKTSYSIDRTYRPEWALPIAARSAKVAGSLLEFISTERNWERGPIPWIVRLTSLGFAAVQAAIPGSIKFRGFSWYLGMAFIFELVVLAVGFIGFSALIAPTIGLLTATLALGLFVQILSEQMRSKRATLFSIKTLVFIVALVLCVSYFMLHGSGWVQHIVSRIWPIHR